MHLSHSSHSPILNLVMGKVGFLFCLLGILSGCSLEASIESTVQSPVKIPVIETKGKLAIAPSWQTQSQDQTGQYSVEGVVGEIMTSEMAESHDGAYRAEVNVRFQTM